MTKITLSRKELFERVWTTPVTQLAKEFGLSDVGFAKLCKRNDIPRPPRGYWAKLEAGQKPVQETLPSPMRNDEIVIYINESKKSFASAEDDLADLEIPAIEVPETLRGAHPLVSDANHDFANQKQNSDGILDARGLGLLDISVSKQQLRRSLRIASAILKTCESIGYQVEAGPIVSIDGQDVGFGITETVETVKEQKDDVDLEGRYEFHFNRYQKKRRPTGRLTLFIADADRYWASGCRKNWRDTKRQKIENCLEKFIRGMILFAQRKHEHEIEEEQKRVETAEREKQRIAEAHRIEEIRNLQKEEQAKLAELIRHVDSWSKSQEIRKFVDAVEASGVMTDERFSEWSRWAHHHADRLDPTKDSPNSILDEVIPEEPKRGYRDYY